MIGRPNCVEPNAERARFCVVCGTPLVTGCSDEERKLTTVGRTLLPLGPGEEARDEPAKARAPADDLGAGPTSAEVDTLLQGAHIP